ncbi:hypothetical protein R1flu_019368 [Riccia fluitans]|uniref:Uncharacterized protein n=1 Tax=Riccia fluitans TaxID=41844 RepID=A0ABD1ZIG3_9MARC
MSRKVTFRPDIKAHSTFLPPAFLFYLLLCLSLMAVSSIRLFPSITWAEGTGGYKRFYLLVLGSGQIFVRMSSKFNFKAAYACGKKEIVDTFHVLAQVELRLGFIGLTSKMLAVPSRTRNHARTEEEVRKSDKIERKGAMREGCDRMKYACSD